MSIRWIRIWLWVAVALVCVAGVDASAQKTTRRGKLVPIPVAPAETAVTDTVTADSLLSQIELTGYEKPLRARRESLFVTSRLPMPVSSIKLRIDYMTMDGVPLHSRELDLDVNLPAAQQNLSAAPDKPATCYTQVAVGELRPSVSEVRRMVTFKSWDVNNLFYYHLNVPARTSTQGTPYRVRLTPIKLEIRNEK